MSEKTSFAANESEETIAASTAAMSGRDLLGVAPLAVGIATVASDGGGPIALIKEMRAASDAIRSLAAEYPGNSTIESALRRLLTATSDLAGTAKNLQRSLSGAKPPEGVEQAVLGMLSGLPEALAGVPESEAAQYREWLYGIAGHVAQASKSGGFLGIGGERVTRQESAFLQRLASELGLAALDAHAAS